jgi:hypothetical protein
MSGSNTIVLQIPNDGSLAHNEGWDLEDNPFTEGCPEFREWRGEWCYMNRKVLSDIKRIR